MSIHVANAPHSIPAGPATHGTRVAADRAGSDRVASSRVTSDRIAADPAEALKHFRAIFRSVRQQMHETERRCGISGSQVWALAVVVDAPGLRVKDLAQAMAVQQSTASNLVEHLARAGLVLRQRDPVDQRIVLLFPTPAGIALVDSEPGSLSGILIDALSRLEPAQLGSLNHLLGQLADALGGRGTARAGTASSRRDARA
ncbi:MAG TPA: MarR family winged helix-turn-helix transcriptional regulator [Burkholderiaceae bacterium]|nr:MarR family winged helix-turn-helix transcriptional regulator [Burkholderiaceae bacterium]